jgi:hypothetical protein
MRKRHGQSHLAAPIRELLPGQKTKQQRSQSSEGLNLTLADLNREGTTGSRYFHLAVSFQPSTRWARRGLIALGAICVHKSQTALYKSPQQTALKGKQLLSQHSSGEAA